MILAATIALAVLPPVIADRYFAHVMPGQERGRNSILALIAWLIFEVVAIGAITSYDGSWIWIGLAHITLMLAMAIHAKKRIRLHYQFAVTRQSTEERPVPLKYLWQVVQALRDAYPTVNVHLHQTTDVHYDLRMNGHLIMTFKTYDKPGG